MKFYFSLQFKRFYRIIKDFGLPPVPTVVLLPIVFLYLSNALFLKTEKASLLYVGIAIYILFLLNHKEKNTFIKTVFIKRDFYKIKLVENIIFTAPFTIFLVFKGYFLFAGLLLLLAILFLFINLNKKATIVIPTPFYKYPFEFIIGFRRFFLLYFVTYFLTFMAIKVGNFNLGVFSILFLSLIIPNFYEKREPTTFVWTYSLNPKKFLYRKIKIATMFTLVSTLPIHLLLWWRFLDSFYITIAVQIMGLCFLYGVIFAKYKHYPKPTLITTIITVGLCLLFPPFFIIIIPYLYKEAIKNISQFL